MALKHHINDRVHQYAGGIVPAEFSKMTASQLPYNIQKGGLNKFRMRPQILNEHVESSREIQSTVTAGNIVGQVFKASQDNINSIYLTLESAEGVPVDNFESYATSAELQAVWAATGNLALLEDVIAESGTQSMALPSDTAGDEWTITSAPADYTGFTGSFDLYCTRAFSKVKVSVFIGDGTNTKSFQLSHSSIDTWLHFDVQEDAMTDDGGTSPVITAITEIGFRVDDGFGGDTTYIDNLIATPPPGNVDVKLWNLGATLPTGSLDSGTQYEQIGDLASGTSASSLIVPLQGGKSLYHIHDFIAGVAEEIPSNEKLVVDNYYAITLNYNDTEVAVYGPNTSYLINYYENGFAFTAPNEATAITPLGTYNDCMFGVFSTDDVYIKFSTAEADAQPGVGSSYYSFIEDKDMAITDIIITHGMRVPQQNMIDLSDKPLLLPKGGKFELYYKDDYTDSITMVWLGIQYYYEPQIAHG